LTVKEIGTRFDKSKIAGLVNEVIGGWLWKELILAYLLNQC
jgi:hypothetical protein